MEKKDDGGRAFPSELGYGITIRDYFAAKAMAKLLPNIEFIWSQKTVEQLNETSRYAYKMADAMLKARK